MRYAFTLIITAAAISYCQSTEPLKTRIGNYEISVRLPSDGLYAGEENEIEFHISDVTQIDPVLGPTPLIRSDVQATISMPAMSGMPKFHEQAHVEGVPGDYGIHPTFAHGGEFRLSLTVRPLSGKPFTADFPLPVNDAQTAKSRKKVAPAFRMDCVSIPKSPKAGEPVTLQITFHGREAAKEALTQFDISHERPVHLVVVRDDLGTFAHIHPEMGPDGIFRVSYTFPSGGEYHLFADVAPKGAGSQILSGRLKVSGNAGQRFSLSQVTPEPVNDGDLSVTLKSSDTVPSMKTLPVTFVLKDSVTQMPPTGMQPYLGAKGHLMMVGENGTTFVHAHPNEENTPGEVTFLARLPKPGLYRAWVQFQRNDVVHTASFIIKGQ